MPRPETDSADTRTPTVEMPRLNEPLALPCGFVLGNRLAKAAMTEQLCAAGRPAPELLRLYERWSTSGAGLLISGNVMVDRRYLEHARNVVADGAVDTALFKQWAELTRRHGAALFMQISHPGRQCPRKVSKRPVAPSAVPLKGFGPLFSKPRALAAGEIPEIVERYAHSAGIARDCGFSGVEIHGAHGYLISQFLSPRTNRRDDDWGGSPEKRRRFLLEVVRAVRRRVGGEFPIAVKLNSADFQRGGFDEDESFAVVEALEAEGVDLLEISGGSYEAPAMMGQASAQRRARSTREREAYFLDYAEKVRRHTRLPLMVTGGFRTPRVMTTVVASGAADLIGLARPMTLEPDFPAQVLAGREEAAVAARDRVGIRTFDVMLQAFWYNHQLRAMGEGGDPDPRRSPWRSLLRGLSENF